jgi:multiple sugar transport system substrate-binding protein
MFVSGLAGFRSAGRWFLPQLKESLDPAAYDVVSWPTTTGNPAESSGIATSFLGINAKTKHPEAAFTFLTEFVSTDGQVFRLKDGGNAVPSIKGADEVVAEGDLPANHAAFITGRDTGFVQPAREARVPGLPQDILKGLDPIWLGEGDAAAVIAALGETVTKALGEA